MVFVCLGILGNILPDDSKGTSNSEAKTHYVIKKVGKKRLTAALATQKLLAKEEKKKKAEYEKLRSELSRNKEKAEEQEQKTGSNEASKSSSPKRSNDSTGNPASNHGDMNTAETGKIVGNRNSHIYHVPGQAGYRMNSANAIYFNSETEAQAAGYRKAKR